MRVVKRPHVSYTRILKLCFKSSSLQCFCIVMADNVMAHFVMLRAFFMRRATSESLDLRVTFGSEQF